MDNLFPFEGTGSHNNIIIMLQDVLNFFLLRYLLKFIIVAGQGEIEGRGRGISIFIAPQTGDRQGRGGEKKKRWTGKSRPSFVGGIY